MPHLERSYLNKLYKYFFQLKRMEFEENKKKLEFILDVNDELLTDNDTSGHFTLNDDVQLLDRDFWGVKTELDRLDGLFSKGKNLLILYVFFFFFIKIVRQENTTRLKSLIKKFSSSVQLESENVCLCVCVSQMFWEF